MAGANVLPGTGNAGKDVGDRAGGAPEADGSRSAPEAGASVPAAKTVSRRRGIYTDEQIAVMEETQRVVDEVVEELMLLRLAFTKLPG